MAEPISLASGLLAITLFAFNSSLKLHQAVKNVKNHPKAISDLIEELGAFIVVLQNLRRAIEGDNIDLEELKGPLFSCGKACEDLHIAITSCTSHSGGGRTSIRDWTKIKFMGDDITTFQDLIARYKSTIMIALCGANLRTVTATASALDEYQAFIMKTILSLDKYFQEKDSNLQSLSISGANFSDGEAIERERLQKEMNTTKECLTICAKVFGDLDQVRLKIFEDICSAHGLHQQNLTARSHITSANRILVDGCEDWKGAVTRTTTQLENHLFRVESTPTASSLHRIGSAEDIAGRMRAQELDASMKDCRDFCTKAAGKVEEARTNIVEDMSAAPGAFQVVVATFGDLLTARRVKADDGAMQLLGQMSDASFQQALQVAEKLGRKSAQGSVQQTMDVAQFEDRYGAGHKFG